MARNRPESYGSTDWDHGQQDQSSELFQLTEQLEDALWEQDGPMEELVQEAVMHRLDPSMLGDPQGPLLQGEPDDPMRHMRLTYHRMAAELAGENGILKHMNQRDPEPAAERLLHGTEVMDRMAAFAQEDAQYAALLDEPRWHLRIARWDRSQEDNLRALERMSQGFADPGRIGTYGLSEQVSDDVA